MPIRLLNPRPGLAERSHAAALAAARAICRRFGYRGLGKACQLATKVFGASAPLVVVTLPTGGRFCMPIYDVSWQSYLYRRREYEPEVEHLFRRIGAMPFHYVDCGANFGYWSAWMAGLRKADLGRIIAIEPSPSCLPVLRQTVTANAPRIDLIPKAIHSTCGEMIPFVVSRHHVASHALTPETDPGGAAPSGAQIVEVETVSLDSIAKEIGLATGPVVVKLDVEGQEIAACEGGNELLSGDALILYEDHGKDRSCRPSAWMLANGYRVFALHEHGMTEMTTVNEIVRFKKRPGKGYNFAAAASDHWLRCL